MIRAAGRRWAGALACALVVTGLAAPAAVADPGVPALPPIGTTTPQNACVKPSTTVVPQLPWAQALLAPQQAWPLATGAGVVVGVVDTGVDAGNDPALAGQVRSSLSTAGGGPADCVGHGSFLAGLVAARKLNDAGFSGMAPGASIVSVRVTDPGGRTTADLLAAGIMQALDGNARIVLTGIGTPAPSPALERAVGQAAARNALVVAPAADDQQGQPLFPAAYPSVLSVAGTGPDGAPISGGRQDTPPRVDLTAPGKQVMSVGPGGPGHFVGSGNGVAAAFVAGAAALVASRHPELGATEIAQLLMRTAYHAAGPLPHPRLGYGTVDPLAAVETTGSGGRAPNAPAQPFRPEAAPPVFRTGPTVLLVTGMVLVSTVLLAGAAAVRRARDRSRPRGEAVDGGTN